MDYQLTRRLGTRPIRYPNRIREYRLRAHLSQKALAGMIGRSRSAISLWERGVSLPTVLDLFKVARALATLGESLYIGLYTLYRPEGAEAKHSDE